MFTFFECVYLYVILHLYVCVNKRESVGRRACEPLPMPFILLRHPRGLCSWLFSPWLHSSRLCEATGPTTPISHFCARREKGRQRGPDRGRRNCSLPRSLSPFPGFVCKLLGGQCHPAALLSQEQGPAWLAQGTVAQSRGWSGGIGPRGLLSPATCPRGGVSHAGRRGWGQVLSLPPAEGPPCSSDGWVA